MRFFSAMTAALLLAQTAPAQLMYVGTYTDGSSKGIYAYRLDPKSGKLTSLGLAAETPEPTFLALHPSGKYLYAVNEMNKFQDKQSGAVTAFAIDKGAGKLRQLNQVSTVGPGPCHLIVDKTGKTLLVANYAGGSFASFPIHPDGSLGDAGSFFKEEGSSVNRGRQEAPHGHSVYVTKNNKFVLAADLGTDKIMIFDLDPANGKMTPHNPPSVSVKPGSGPRHLAIAPDQKHVYALTEMASSVIAFDFDASNASMKEIQTISALPSDFKGQSTAAEIEMDDSGTHVYTSNRGNDSIAVFTVDKASGKLTLEQIQSSGGKTPRGFMLDPSGKFLIAGNQTTNNFVVFRVDSSSGKLTPTGDTYEVGAPVSFVFVK
jgi:6-phosphogluconolactonase